MLNLSKSWLDYAEKGVDSATGGPSPVQVRLSLLKSAIQAAGADSQSAASRLNDNTPIAPDQTVAKGPRTSLGKQRSSRNAMKHGLFSRVILLPLESESEYKNLLSKLRKDRKPIGQLEELLVEKLATIVWRQRRLLSAEAAEIAQSRNNEALFFDPARKSSSSLEISNQKGLIYTMSAIAGINLCQVLLSCLRGQIKRKGLNQLADSKFLDRIYGVRTSGGMMMDAYDCYNMWLIELDRPKSDPGRLSEEQCRNEMLKVIDEELDVLREFRQLMITSVVAESQLDFDRHGVPDTPALDRLLRYEASLERSFDRTLSQLERVQRIRLGQTVWPEANVRVTVEK